MWGSARNNPGTKAARESADVLRVGTDLLHTASESFVTDPQLVLDTAELLRMRGDPTSAALLLHAVDRTNPHVGRIEAALAAYVPPGARGRRRLRRALLLGLGAVVFLVSGIAGYPTIALLWGIAIGAIEIVARTPGLNRFDTGVLDLYTEKAGLRPFFLVPRSVADETPLGARRQVLPLVLGILALVLGIVVFPGARAAAAAHGQPAGWVTSPGLSCFLVWIVLFPVLVMWAVSLVPGRRLGYAVPRLSAAQAECQCRRWASVAGPYAFAYAQLPPGHGGDPGRAAARPRPLRRRCPRRWPAARSPARPGWSSPSGPRTARSCCAARSGRCRTRSSPRRACRPGSTSSRDLRRDL